MKPTFIVYVSQTHEITDCIGYWVVVVGCGTSADNTTKPTPQMGLTLSEKVVGTYEIKEGGETLRAVSLANGKVKSYDGNGEKDKEGTWKLVGKEVHIEEVDIEEVTDILKIEPNGDLTVIALIQDGKRTDQKRITLKKLK